MPPVTIHMKKNDTMNGGGADDGFSGAVAIRPRRPHVVAEQLRELIVSNGLQPGDRLPGAWLVSDTLKVSRGTLREALKVLESQGLIRTKTGPGGGVFVESVSSRHAIRLLDNLFLRIVNDRPKPQEDPVAVSASDLESLLAEAEIDAIIPLFWKKQQIRKKAIDTVCCTLNAPGSDSINRDASSCCININRIYSSTG